MRFVHSASRQRTDVHAAQLNGTVLYNPTKRAISRAMVDFPLPEGPTRALTVPGAMLQIDSVQYLLVVIGKADILQLDGVVRRQLSARSGRCISSPDSTSATSPTMVVTCAMSSV